MEKPISFYLLAKILKAHSMRLAIDCRN